MVASAAASIPAASAIVPRLAEPPRERIEWPAQALPEREAWRALAALWGAPEAVCDKSKGQPLGCFRAQDITLALIRQLDRPGLVTLNDGKGGRVPALLTALDRDRATLHLGEQPQSVTLAAFGAAWRGDFGTFWRAPGQALPQWLAASAASSPAEISARLRAFQRGQGLPADGVAGALTQMQINRALGIDEPRLVDTR